MTEATSQQYSILRWIHPSSGGLEWIDQGFGVVHYIAPLQTWNRPFCNLLLLLTRNFLLKATSAMYFDSKASHVCISFPRRPMYPLQIRHFGKHQKGHRTFRSKYAHDIFSRHSPTCSYDSPPPKLNLQRSPAWGAKNVVENLYRSNNYKCIFFCIDENRFLETFLVCRTLRLCLEQIYMAI